MTTNYIEIARNEMAHNAVNQVALNNGYAGFMELNESNDESVKPMR